MREKDMENPNKLGHYHRDIVSAVRSGRSVTLTLSCGHIRVMALPSYKKHFLNKANATLCGACNEKDEQADVTLWSYGKNHWHIAYNPSSPRAKQLREWDESNNPAMQYGESLAAQDKFIADVKLAGFTIAVYAESER